MSDDKILLDKDMEVGHGNRKPPTEPPTHQPDDQPPPPTNQPEDQPSTQQQPYPQPEPQPDHANNMPGSSNDIIMPAGRGRGVNTGIYIYTGLLFTKLPMHKIDRTRMNEGWGRGRRRRGNQ